jgi:DNA-3-methyladenine glycosylase II
MNTANSSLSAGISSEDVGRSAEATGSVPVGASNGGAVQIEVLRHLRACDPVLSALIEQIGPAGLPDSRAGRPDEHYGALVRSIVGQQLSTKAAAAIYRRLTDRYAGLAPTPDQILAEDPEQLRAAVGLSRAKVTYLRSLAEHLRDGSLRCDDLGGVDDDGVIAELTAVKGIGVWTAHMFLMFHLQRPDVLPTGDLGIRRAMMVSYGLAALPDPEAMQAVAQPWRPYRTLACRYLWRSLDNEPV